MEGVELVCVVDTDEDRAKEVAEQFGTRWSTDVEDGIKDAVAASIAVPTVEHFRVASICIEHGLDVLVEKSSVDKNDIINLFNKYYWKSRNFILLCRTWFA